eukprot:1897508-Rhodomonas_salina.3
MHTVCVREDDFAMVPRTPCDDGVAEDGIEGSYVRVIDALHRLEMVPNGVDHLQVRGISRVAHAKLLRVSVVLQDEHVLLHGRAPHAPARDCAGRQQARRGPQPYIHTAAPMYKERTL